MVQACRWQGRDREAAIGAGAACGVIPVRPSARSPVPTYVIRRRSTRILGDRSVDTVPPDTARRSKTVGCVPRACLYALHLCMGVVGR